MTDLNDLITAYSLCACNGECSRSCVVCNSPAWAGRCVRQRWNEHAASTEGQRAAERFNNMAMGVPVNSETEKVIDFADELMGGIEPWQARALRSIFSQGR